MNITLKAVSALLLATPLLYAGGDIEEVGMYSNITEISTDGIPSFDHRFYVGLGYSLIKKENDTAGNKIVANGAHFQAGYKFHDYAAVEFKALSSIGDVRAHNADQDWTVSNVGLYIKPQYAFNDFTVYALVGYGASAFEDDNKHSVRGIQYGAGASFKMTDNLDAYAEYVHLYDNTSFDDIDLGNDVSLYTVNVGVAYNF